MKLGFSLLHYNNYQITEKAIEALLDLDGIESCMIVIVDNASPNGSGDHLFQKYKNYENVHVILNKSNSGFAEGNNIGYMYLKNSAKCDVICVMNSDVIITDSEFVKKLDIELKTNRVDVLAPNILGRHGAQNPFRLKPISTRKACLMYLYNGILSVAYRIPLVNLLIVTLLEGKKKRQEKGLIDNSNGNNSIMNCIPHGACIIYGDSWISSNDFAFLPGTFLYFEEDILGDYILQSGHSVKYCPDLTVNHEEDSSVEYSTDGVLKKRQFIAKCMKNSIKVFLKLRKNYIR